jgi:hypothetical protein
VKGSPAAFLVVEALERDVEEELGVAGALEALVECGAVHFPSLSLYRPVWARHRRGFVRLLPPSCTALGTGQPSQANQSQPTARQALPNHQGIAVHMQPLLLSHLHRPDHQPVVSTGVASNPVQVPAHRTFFFFDSNPSLQQQYLNDNSRTARRHDSWCRARPYRRRVRLSHQRSTHLDAMIYGAEPCYFGVTVCDVEQKVQK